ncbi:tRNA lysidine(34) synthetase TilS [Sphingomonas sp. A2-49]|uniref:tRNA lysidine(34) synthetase TilS n=1 Tax=Sphingomonas sp. A2-49 TaxID=1391375 RepID=UPI0021D04F8B|nr:tRNA lysidine(34) synthetase TilS [Sphingomonas sp. A2-49]MCU6454246.1 tRNA lysidine(34) synthetase TilS [Sphingomonas sp. A2-49]
MSRRAVPPPSASEPFALEAERFHHDLIRALGHEPRGAVLFAVSGGPDSMAMLTLAAATFGARVRVATVDHRLRAAAADEAAMVAGHCAAIGVAHATLVPAEPIAGASIQAAARHARYRLLAGHAAAIGAEALATAHHVDDQAETFLMRAARGSGIAGLAGVRPRATIDGATVLRPLLEWRRAELRAIVRRAEVPFVDDPSNHDPAHDRTRFRRLLDANEWLGPPQLARSAAALAEADGDVRAIVAWLWASRATQGGGGVRIAVDGLPRELTRRLARRAIGTVIAEAGIVAPKWSESANVEALLDALAAGRRATQAGVLVTPQGDEWRFRPAPARRAT